MGVSQHFFDQRAFSDAVDKLYQQGSTTYEKSEELWFVEFLIVIAIAKLVEGRSNEERPPGISEFLEALQRLPNVRQLRKEGALAVETLTLVAVYYQCCDRKENAYVYVSNSSDTIGSCHL